MTKYTKILECPYCAAFIEFKFEMTDDKPSNQNIIFVYHKEKCKCGRKIRTLGEYIKGMIITDHSKLLECPNCNFNIVFNYEVLKKTEVVEFSIDDGIFIKIYHDNICDECGRRIRSLAEFV